MPQAKLDNFAGGRFADEGSAHPPEKSVDNARWQVKRREDAYVEVWADANARSLACQSATSRIVERDQLVVPDELPKARVSRQ